MSGRPEILFPLFANLETLEGVGPKSAASLTQIDIGGPRDLLFTLPYTGVDRRKWPTIRGTRQPATVTVEVTVGGHYPPHRRGKPYHVEVSDAEETFQLVFFHAHAEHLKRVLPVGQQRIVSGRLEVFDGLVRMPHPDHIVRLDESGIIPDFEPLYPLTGDLTQRVMRRAAQSAQKRAPELAEWIEPGLKAREGWPDWRTAILAAHNPASAAELSPDTAARQRLAYDEFFAHQLTLGLARTLKRRAKGIASYATGELQSRVLNTLTYRPTAAQTRVIAEISADMAAPVRMNRLLQGDVGSGKTLVAFMALLMAVEAGGQGAMMAPTEILAQQHLAVLRPLAERADTVMEILTGRDTGRGRQQKLVALAQGDTRILIGTHAVFQKDVAFHNLRLAVIDEQHRFGVRQRMELRAKGAAPDVLVMTATPIPRSLALAQYGDMDVSTLDEKPPGRKSVGTALISARRITEVVQHLRRAITKGRQAYWVCPLVEESEVVDLTAAEKRFEHLRSELGEDAVGLVHGRMSPAERDAAMVRFAKGETRILVATTVIEVGVDVPNASIMVVERAENFGLAQLHQLRGRVGRGDEKSTCLLMFQQPLSASARRRLEVLRETEDGFRISEEDLAMRGAGDVIGTAQSGLPRFRVGDLERQATLMSLAQSDARMLLADDPSLEKERGQAARVLLWLMEQDKAISLLSVG